jgi:hypothetical protein
MTTTSTPGDPYPPVPGPNPLPPIPDPPPDPPGGNS